MVRRFALSAIGQDRPGIVAAVSEVLFRLGCNIEDSAMTILWGQFAMILVVAPPEGLASEQIREELARVGRELQLQVSLSPLQEAETEQAQVSEPGQAYLVSVYGADHPGIVWRTTDYLAQRQVNITDLSTRMIQGQGAVYIMLLEVQAPPQLPQTQFEQDLRLLSQELKVDISLRPLIEESI